MELGEYPFSEKYGLSWQIMLMVHCDTQDEMFNPPAGGKDEQKIARVTQAFLKMKKFNIAALKQTATELKLTCI